MTGIIALGSVVSLLGTAGGFLLKAVGFNVLKKVLGKLLEHAIGAFGSEKFIIGIVLKAGERIVKSTENKLDDYWFEDFKKRVLLSLEEEEQETKEAVVEEEIKEDK